MGRGEWLLQSALGKKLTSADYAVLAVSGVFWSFDIGLITHIGFSLMVRVFRISLFCPTDQFGSLVFLCRTCDDVTADCSMDGLYGGWPMKAAFDNTSCMRPSNDINRDTVVDLTTLGVVDLDTSLMPDMFSLRAFDSREPVVRVLPGEFLNTIRVLVPGATAMPIGFYDVMLENLANTPDHRARSISPADITTLKIRWPSSLFVDMHKQQADMETLCRNCKREFDSGFGSGRAGNCPHCGTYVISNLSRHIIEYQLSQLWWCPVGWCSVWKGTAHDCIDHLHGKPNTAKLVELKTRGKFFPSWTVSRETWCAALRPEWQ